MRHPHTAPLALSACAFAFAFAATVAACGGDGHDGAHDHTHGPDATSAHDVTLGDADAGQRPDLGGGDGLVTEDRVSHVDLGGGVTATTVDATDAEAWVYLDVAGQAQAFPSAPADDGGWDLAFQRFRIAVNGGVTGSGGVAVAVVEGGDFEGLTRAPAEGYVTDAAPEGDDEGLAFLIEGGWYSYDAANHTLAPRPDRVYVLRDRRGDHFKIRVVDYYDGAGSAGVVTFHWAAVDPPVEVTPADQVTIDAPAETDTHLDLSDAAVVSPSTPSESLGWDVAIIGMGLATNGGTSGPGVAGAIVADVAYDALEATDTVGFAVDREIPLPGPPGSGTYSGNPVLADWFDYDGSTHTVWPKDQAFVVRDAEGDYAKLRIVAVDGAAWTLRIAPLARAPRAHTLALTTSDEDDPVYVSLRDAAIVDVEDPGEDPRWDLAFHGLTIRTNGGTSGLGEGAAVALEDTPFDTLDGVDPGPLGWTEDTMLPVPGPPGSGETSGNAALGAWYDYDMETHAVTATADLTFVVRTADGGLAKLALVEADGEDYELRWTYAGPGHTSFGAAE